MKKENNESNFLTMKLVRYTTQKFFAIVVLTIASWLGATHASLAQTNVVADNVEFAALKALYDSLGGATWTTKTNWPLAGSWPASATAAQMATWYGVTVANGDITSVSFSNNNLAGKLPAAVATLTALKTLSLLTDKLSGNLPTALNQLTALTYFNISSQPSLTGNIPDLSAIPNLGTFVVRNCLGLTPAPIPTWITSKTTLTKLDLNGTKRNGSIPTAISSLVNLTSLDLSTNLITGAIPSSMGSLTNLTILNLSGNQLSGSIPASLGSLTKLTALYLFSNLLTGSIPVEFGNLLLITDLELYSNQLSGSIPSSLGNLNKLIYLYLYSNTLTGSIPNEIGNMTALKYLYLHANKLTGSIPSTLGSLSNLLSLQLQSNQLSGALPPELGNLTKLTTLYLNSNFLSGTLPSTFSTLINLTSLYVYSNQLSGELPASLGALNKLQIFYIAGNQFTGSIPSSYSGMTEIRQFLAGTNKLSGSVPDIFSGFTKMTNLDLSYNSFTGAFPSSVGNCVALTVLYGHYNNFTSLPSSLLNLPATANTTIYFTGNNLTSIPNFATHVNKAKLSITMPYNQLDFSQIEPMVGAGLLAFSYAPQKNITDITTQSLTAGADFVLTARPKGGATSNIKWEKLPVNGNTWQDISSSNADPITGVTYRIASATTGAEGKYRWSCTSTTATGMTLMSDPIEVKTPIRFNIDNLGFQYKYDKLNRMIGKKVPGADWVYMVYDDRDRLVLTQDGEQRKLNRWTFTKYDVLNRPVMTGIYTHTGFADQSQMQSVVSTFYTLPLPGTKSWYETYIGTGVANGYDNKSFPQISNGNLCTTVTYYDNYNFKSLFGAGFNYVTGDVPTQTVNGKDYSQPAANLLTNSLVTGSRIKVLQDGLVAGSNWLNSVNYYDDKSRVVQTIADNQRGGRDRSTILYDFTGKVLMNKVTDSPGDIQWKDLVKVSISGNTVTNTNTVNGWVSGFASVQSLAANTDGWLEVTVSELTTNRMIGLSATNPDANYTTINYALYLSTSNFQIYENGVVKGSTIPMSTGDVLRIERTGTNIKYYRNGVLAYTSLTPSSSSLLIDASLYSPAATLLNTRASFVQPQTELTVARQFTYDQSGRLLKTWHSVNGATPVLLAANEYNELGQLVDKKLYNTDPASTPDTQRKYKQSVDYRYNIRGWLTRINDGDVRSTTNLAEDGTTAPPDFFGMNLHYNDLVSGLTNAGDEQYAGNISSIEYSNGQGFVSLKERGYKFGYDPLNRLKAATHAEKTSVWTTATSYHEDNLSYDLNGNIQTLNRKGDNGASIDVLTYNYGTGNTVGNQLQTVSDGGDIKKGFADGNIGSIDYNYDANGNMVIDRNKGLVTSAGANGITYNYLNLPEKVIKTTGEYVKYIYDAGGRKLSQQVFNSVGVLQKKTDYLGELIYENDVLEYLQHEEGRVLMNDRQWLYQNDGSILAGVPTTGATTYLAPNGTENYIQVYNSGSTARDGVYPIGGTLPVAAGERYLLRARGYRTGATDVVFQIRGNGGAIDLTTTVNSLAPSAVEERWSEQVVTIPTGITDLQVGLVWVPAATGQIFYLNDFEIVKLNSTSPEYQYHLKDHLGNVRATFTAKPNKLITTATLEDNHINEDRSSYLKYDDARRVNSYLFDHTNGSVPTTTTGDAQRLNGTANEKYGLARSLSVMPGDTIQVEVYAKYVDTNNTNWTGALATLLNAIATGTAPAGTVIDGSGYATSGQQAFPFGGLLDKSTDTGLGPKAYLNYLVFDKSYALIPSKSGFKRLSNSSREYGQDALHEQLSKVITIDQPGYVYMYLSNEEATPVEVYFDDFKVTHTKYPVIQTDDYYPFGLTFNSYQRENSFANKYLFNKGSERQEDLGLNVYQTHYRILDPAIGRWWQEDPRGDDGYLVELTPYNFGDDNPILKNDPNGDCPWCVGAVVGALVETGLQLTEIALDKNKSISDFSFKSVAVSAATGAIGVGIASKVGKFVKLGKLANTIISQSTEAAVDAAGSAAGQYVKDGKVDLMDVAIDVAAGRTVGNAIGYQARKIATNSPQAKLLTKQLDRVKRIAGDNPRPGRAMKVEAAQNKLDGFIERRAVAAGTSSSNTVSGIVKDTKKKEEDKNKAQ